MHIILFSSLKELNIKLTKQLNWTEAVLNYCAAQLNFDHLQP